MQARRIATTDLPVNLSTFLSENRKSRDRRFANVDFWPEMNSTKAFSSKEEMLDRLTLNFVKPENDDLKTNDVTHLFISIFIDQITSKSNSCIYYGIIKRATSGS